MCTPQINCYCAQVAPQSFTFYILSKGQNAGQPNLAPWVNAFIVQCSSKEELDFYFWLSYSLWQTGRYKQYLRGSVIPFLSVHDVRKLLQQVAESIMPHWRHYQTVVDALGKLRMQKKCLAQCIIANEKLQQMLLRIYF
jgi:hypothetical protein